MANHQVPRGAVLVEKNYGRDAGGNTVAVAAYRYQPPTDRLPKFYLVAYQERDGKVVRSTRATQQFSGASGAERFAAELADSREMLAASLRGSEKGGSQ